MWNQTFGFDPFGNISKSATAGISFLPTYSQSTNRYSSVPGCAPSYDANGFALNDCAHSYTWDSAGNPLTIDAVNLTYDALGRMVEQARGATYTQIVYGPGGGKLALMNGQTLTKAFVPLPAGGAAVYTSTGLTYYRHADWLGSGRLATTPTTRTTYFDVAYGPYGEGYASSGSVDLNFTGQNQDTVSGLYDFLFREYNANHGRWPWPDPAGMGAVSMGNPQTWNRYAYVGNMPLSDVDALGLLGRCSDACRYLRDMAHSAGLFSRFEFFTVTFGRYWDDGWHPYVIGLVGTGGSEGGTSSPPVGAANTGLKQKICSAIPSGRTMGVSGGVGGVGSVGGGGELVVNYNSGQVSAFGFGGVQIGWNGGLSGSGYSGFVWGLNNSNSNYSGGFTGVNGGAGLGGFVASSSGGLTGGPSGLIPNPRQVTAAGVSLGGGLLGGFSGGVTATDYSNPAQLAKFWAFSPLDWMFYLAGKAC